MACPNSFPTDLKVTSLVVDKTLVVPCKALIIDLDVLNLAVAGGEPGDVLINIGNDDTSWADAADLINMHIDKPCFQPADDIVLAGQTVVSQDVERCPIGANFAFGSHSTEQTVAASNTRMTFVQTSTAPGSFRAGTVTGTQWNAVNRGDNSVAFGLDNIAQGTNSFASGIDNVASGASASAFGNGNTSSGQNSVVGGGQNEANAINSAIVAGNDNLCSCSDGFMGGGASNNCAGTNRNAIVAGNTNTIPVGTSSDSIIGAGTFNRLDGASCGIFSGDNNNIAGSAFCVIGGGFLNMITGGATSSGVISGGFFNRVSAPNGMIAGGTFNIVDGAASFASGTGAHTNSNPGTFVWADATGLTAPAATPNSWHVKASGGSTFWSDAGATMGVNLAAGTAAWAGVCDKNVKRDIREIEYTSVLDRVDRLKLYDFCYKGDPKKQKNMGPMAQDWHQLFPSTKDPLKIDTMDLDGVALSAIKALLERVRSLEDRLKVFEE